MNQHSMNRGPDSYNNGSVCEVPPVRKCLKSRGGFPPSQDGFRTARSHGEVGRLFLSLRSKPLEIFDRDRFLMLALRRASRLLRRIPRLAPIAISTQLSAFSPKIS